MKNPWSDELYRPPIYMIYTQYNTQNYYQQNTWSKPPLLPRLTEKKNLQNFEADDFW